MDAAQLTGIAACAVSVGAPALRSDRQFKTMILIAAGLWALYYWILGAMSGFAFTLLIAVRQVLSIFAHRFSATARRCGLSGMLLAMAAVAALTWEDWYSLLPLAASVNAACAYFMHAGVRLRAQLFFGDWAWLAYAALVQAWPHFVFIGTVLTVNLMTIRRLRRDGQPEQGGRDSLGSS